MRTRVYVAGPISAPTRELRDENVRRAMEVGKLLVGYGFAPLVPHLDAFIWPGTEPDDPETLAWDVALEIDEPWVLACEAVFRIDLPSKGADREEALARKHGIPVFTTFADIVTWNRERPEVGSETALEEAQRLVHGPRQGDYGHPLDDFTRTGRIWAAVLGLDEVTPEQVAMCMVGLKLSRECNRPKRDNRVDAAGYVETLELVRTERERREADAA